MSLAQSLSPYRAMFGSRFREELQYRAAAIAGLITQVVFGFIMLMVLMAFYESSESERPMSVAQVVAYVWLGQAMLGMLPWNVDPVVVSAIRTGDVAQELLRPVDTYRLWCARVAAWRIVRTGLRLVPMLVIAMFVFPAVGLEKYAMPGPASWGAFGLFVPAIVLSVLLSVGITVLMQVIMLWTVSPEGVLRFVPAIVIFFSGSLIPLPLLPDWMWPVLKAQPFRGLTDTPFRIYGGDLVGAEAWIAMGWSAGWVVVLAVAGAWGLRKGFDRLAVAGG